MGRFGEKRFVWDFFKEKKGGEIWRPFPLFFFFLKWDESEGNGDNFFKRCEILILSFINNNTLHNY